MQMRITRVICVTNRSSSIPKYWGAEWRGQAEPLPRMQGFYLRWDVGGPGVKKGWDTHQTQETAELLQGSHTAQEGKAHGENS